MAGRKWEQKYLHRQSCFWTRLLWKEAYWGQNQLKLMGWICILWSGKSLGKYDRKRLIHHSQHRLRFGTRMWYQIQDKQNLTAFSRASLWHCKKYMKCCAAYSFSSKSRFSSDVMMTPARSSSADFLHQPKTVSTIPRNGLLGRRCRSWYINRQISVTWKTFSQQGF